MAYQIRSKEEIVKEVETSNSNLISTIETKEQEFKNQKLNVESQENKLAVAIEDLSTQLNNKDKQFKDIRKEKEDIESKLKAKER